MACSFCFFLRLVPPKLTLFGFTASHMVVELFLYVIIYSSLTLSIFILLCYIYLLIDLIMLAKVSEFVWYWVGCREILFHVSLPLEMLAPLSLQPKLRQRLIFFGFSQIDLWFVNNLSFFFLNGLMGFVRLKNFYMILLSFFWFLFHMGLSTWSYLILLQVYKSMGSKCSEQVLEVIILP